MFQQLFGNVSENLSDKNDSVAFNNENMGALTDNASSTIPLIYKVYFLDSAGNESRVVVFAGNNSDANALNAFSDSEKKYLEEKNLVPEYSTQQIHIDDSIRAVKKKIISEYGITQVSYEEIYMFSRTKSSIHLWKAYQEITKNESIPLTTNMIGQLLVNLNLPMDRLDILDEIIRKKNAANISYDDLLKLDIYQDDYDISMPIGMKFMRTHNFLFSANPFDILTEPLYEPSSKNPLLALDNELLLNYMKSYPGEAPKTNIYVALFGNVLEYAKQTRVESEFIIRCYYPYLSEKEILTESQFLQNQQALIDGNKRIIKDQTRKYYETIDMFYNTYYGRQSNLPYSTKGIRSFEFIIHPDDKIILPLDVIFKQVHATSIIPYIKYNPGFRREHLYRLYSEKTSKIGKKIPVLTKSQINSLISVTGKSNQISFVVSHKINEVFIDIFVDVEKNGNVIIRSDNTGEYTQKSKTVAILSVNDMLTIINNTVNPILHNINEIIEQTGHKLIYFTNINADNVEIVDIGYHCGIFYSNKISLTENMSCLSTIFDIIDDDINKGAALTYKRVNNFKKMDAQSSMITEVFKRTNNERSVVVALMTNYGKTEEEALMDIVQYFNNHTRLNGRFVNKNVDISENPGFPTMIRLLPFEKKCIIEISNIDSIEYLHSIEIYLDSFLRFSQKPDEIPEVYVKLCKKTKEVVQDETHVQNVVAAVEIKPIEMKANVNDFFEEEGEPTGEGEPTVPPSTPSLNDEGEDEGEDEDEGILFDEEEEEEDEAILFDEPESQTSVNSESSKKSNDSFGIGGGNSEESPENSEETPSMEKRRGLKGEPSVPPEYIYEPGTKEAEQLLKGWSKKNVLFNKMKKLEPKLFLSSSSGKYTAYTRICPTNVNRQPIILTDEEKEKVDKEHAGSYTNAIQYGSDPNKKFWYICPRYWCTLTNLPMTEEEVKRGECGGKIMPPDIEKNPPAGHYIYEFTDNKYHSNKDGSYAYSSPGFSKSNSHPDGLCLPCCFKNWDSVNQKLRREQCSASGKEDLREGNDTENQRLISYVIRDKFPIPQYRWGFLPISIELFLHTNNELVVSKINKNEIEKNTPCLLRYGVEQSITKSFIGCIADIYAYKKNMESAPKISEMLKIISESITLDSYLKYHNGSLVSVFQPKKIEIDDAILSKYHATDFYQSLRESIEANKEAEIDFFEDTVASFENFLTFLNDERSTINHTYLWDIITSENSKLFGGGVNMAIIEIANDDITNNIRLLCPTNSYSDKFYDTRKETIILIKQDDFYEPVYLFENKDNGTGENTIFVQKTFSENIMDQSLKEVLGMIQRTTGRYCAAQPSLPDVYKFKTNINAKELYLRLRKMKYDIVSQVMNYQGKIIALMTQKVLVQEYVEEKGEITKQKSNDFNPTVYLPCSPSTKLPELSILYMDADGLWNSYDVTRKKLEEIHAESKGEILCSPMLKVIEDGMVIGLLTETNQFIQLSSPYSNIDDGLDEIDGTNYIIADKQLILGRSPDTKRVDIIKKITLETQFYNAFRSTLRIALNEYENKDVREKVIHVLETPFSSYSNKLEKMVKLIRFIMKDLVIFNIIDDELLDTLRTISTCTSNCDTKKYCLLSEGKQYKLILPKKNLLVPETDNEKKYFYTIADELLRYNRTRLFMLNTKQFLNISSVEYQIFSNEFIILHSLLIGSYFDDLIPFQMNEYIDTITYEFANPIISQKYSNAVSLEQQNKKEEEKKEETEEESVLECVKETIPLIGNSKSYWRIMFPKDAREWVFDNTKYCTYYLLMYIFKKIYNKNLSVQNIKVFLWNSYEPYLKTHKKQIMKILSKQGKRDIIERVKTNAVNFEDMIMSEEYYLSTLDIWLFSQKANVPIMLFTGNMLTDLNMNLKWLLLGGFKEDGSVDVHRPYYFIRPHTGIKEANFVQDFHMVTTPYKLSELAGMITMVMSDEYEVNRQTFASFIGGKP